jgi:hypothetical protein
MVWLQGVCQGLAKQQGLWRALLKSSWQLLSKSGASAEAASASDDHRQSQSSAGDATGRQSAENAAAAAAGSVPAGIKLTQCPLLNVSICLPSVTGTAPAASSSSFAARKLQMAAAAAAAAASGRVFEGSSSSSSSSDVAAAASNADNGLLVVVYNSLAWPRQEWVRVPVAATAGGARYTVQGE